MLKCNLIYLNLLFELLDVMAGMFSSIQDRIMEATRSTENFYDACDTLAA